jgi:hypothetical protein
MQCAKVGIIIKTAGEKQGITSNTQEKYFFIQIPIGIFTHASAGNNKRTAFAKGRTAF